MFCLFLREYYFQGFTSLHSYVLNDLNNENMYMERFKILLRGNIVSQSHEKIS